MKRGQGEVWEKFGMVDGLGLSGGWAENLEKCWWN